MNAASLSPEAGPESVLSFKMAPWYFSCVGHTFVSLSRTFICFRLTIKADEELLLTRAET